MHIKEVQITGFRSYRELTRIDTFDRGQNVIVGRNGSGKSNFFHAIQFVLSEEFASMKQDIRLQMLHEGTGPRIGTARVEIVFDNSDRRIVSNDSNEVRVVRQIGNKKDQYFIDGKVVSRSEVVNLLESAGISRSNPYFIVKQGKINELATSADEYRLKLLREVAGTRVYDERKDESKKILEENAQKQEKVQSLLKFIQDRLKSLESEKDDLKEYQKWDKDKRSIEYTIYEKEIKTAKEELERLTALRDELHRKQNHAAQELMDNQNSLVEVQTRKRKLDTQFKGIKEEKDILLTEKEDRLKKKAELELQIADLREDVDKDRVGKSSAREKMDSLTREIDDKKAQLETLVPEFERLLEEEQRVATDTRIKETRCKELLAKQGQKKEFKTKDERDVALKRKINDLRAKIDHTEDTIDKLKREIERDTGEEETMHNEAANLRLELDEASSSMQRDGEELVRKKKELEQATTFHQESLREQKRAHEDVESFDVEMRNLENAERNIAARSCTMAVEGMNKILDELREKGDPNSMELVNNVKGILMDHISCDEQFFTAIESVAGTKMYNYIVDSDRTATKLLDLFNAHNCRGQVAFLPLNKIKGERRHDLPADGNCRPAIDILDIPRGLEPIFYNLFAKVVLVRDLIGANAIARQYGVTCVTLEGDKAERSGALTGGYTDMKRSKLELRKKLGATRKQKESIQRNLDSLGGRVMDKLRAIEQIKQQINTLELNMKEAKYRHRNCDTRKANIEDTRMQIARGKELKKGQLRDSINRLRELKAALQTLEGELGTEMESQLGTQDAEEISRLQREIQTMRKDQARIQSDRLKKESEKTKIENMLEAKLLKTKNELERKLNDITGSEKQQKLNAENEELRAVTNRLREITKRVGSIDDELSHYDEQNSAFLTQIENFMDQQRDLEQSVAEYSKKADTIVTDQSNYQTKRDEATKKTRDLGTLPADAFGKYNSWSRSQLDKKLAECMKELRKYENVNKKALDQFVAATTQKEELEARLSEQEDNKKAIEDLMEVLDHRKFDAMKLTFKQVSKNFAEVFTKLVPAGHGNLVWRANRSEDATQFETRDDVEQLTGIGINVSFGGHDPSREMKQLSGGQKSLVALALIFAIQKCDPAPFYLFDEIDAALDPAHRKAVADMIYELSENAQFIITTFRAELLQKAKMCYGVRFRNKVSHIDQIDFKDAQEFIETDAIHS